MKIMVQRQNVLCGQFAQRLQELDAKKYLEISAVGEVYKKLPSAWVKWFRAFWVQWPEDLSFPTFSVMVSPFDSEWDLGHFYVSWEKGFNEFGKDSILTLQFRANKERSVFCFFRGNKEETVADSEWDCPLDIPMNKYVALQMKVWDRHYRLVNTQERLHFFEKIRKHLFANQ